MRGTRGMRFMGVDLGDRRTGLAVGDDVLRVASPAGLIEASAGDERLLRELISAAEEHLGPRDAFVLGLPLNMDGSEGPRAKAVRTFGDELGRRSGRGVLYFDERLTTAEADWKMARTGLTRDQKKKRRDAMAAAAMLQGFLDDRGASEQGPDGRNADGPAPESDHGGTT